MKDGGRLLELVNLVLATTIVATLLGCAAYVGDGYGGTVVVPGPVFYGDFHERGHEVRAYSHRGYESRGEAHHERRDRH